MLSSVALKFRAKVVGASCSCKPAPPPSSLRCFGHTNKTHRRVVRVIQIGCSGSIAALPTAPSSPIHVYVYELLSRLANSSASRASANGSPCQVPLRPQSYGNAAYFIVGIGGEKKTRDWILCNLFFALRCFLTARTLLPKYPLQSQGRKEATHTHGRG